MVSIYSYRSNKIQFKKYVDKKSDRAQMKLLVPGHRALSHVRNWQFKDTNLCNSSKNGKYPNSMHTEPESRIQLTALEV